MEREQIIKALECCTVGIGTECEKCPYMLTKFCNDVLKKEALALINSQKQKIKELSEENERLRADLTELTHRMQDNVRAENEELCKSNECDKRKLEADTVRKMQKRLKARLDRNVWDIAVAYAQKIVDEIAKETLEGL